MNSVTHDDQFYLLRLWKTGLEGGPSWRASLESPNTGTRQGFISLQDLFAFLSEACEEDSAPAQVELAGALHTTIEEAKGRQQLW